MRDSRNRTALREALSRPPTSPNRAAVLHLLASCSKARLTVNLANWIRVARHERNRAFLDIDSSDDEEDDDMVYFFLWLLLFHSDCCKLCLFVCNSNLL